jgi:uncharacterized protein HemX
MKNITLTTVILAAFSLGFLTTGCGESKETKENIAKQTRLMEQEAAARKKAEEEKQKNIDEQIKFQEEVVKQRKERRQNSAKN